MQATLTQAGRDVDVENLRIRELEQHTKRLTVKTNLTREDVLLNIVSCNFVVPNTYFWWPDISEGYKILTLLELFMRN